MCSIDGAWLAPIPPITLAMSASALAPLLADLRQRRAGHAGELDHHVDRHAVPPQPDPVSAPHQVLLFVGQAELVHPCVFLTPRNKHPLSPAPARSSPVQC